MAIGLDFGCAASQYKVASHPRLLISPGDEKRIRTACRKGVQKKLHTSLREKVMPLIDLTLGCADVASLVGNPTGARNGGSKEGARVTHALDDIAFIGVVDDNENAIEAVRRVLVSKPANSGNNFNVHFAYDLVWPRLSESDRSAFVSWAAESVERSRKLISDDRYLLHAGGNIMMSYMLNGFMYLLATIGDAGAPDYSKERAAYLRYFEAAINSAVGPEGYPAEDIGYGTLMSSRLCRMGSCLRRAGWFDAYAQGTRLSRFGRAMLHFVQPWGGFLSNTGDHGDDFGGRDLALAHLARINRDASLTWLLGTLSYTGLDPEYRHLVPPEARETTLAKNVDVPRTWLSLVTLMDAPASKHPSKLRIPTAFKDSDRGIVSFRSGWTDNDTYVYFDGSQRPTAAQGHAHDSGGHFCLSAYREYFAISPGRYGIEQDQHNVMLVDGKSGRSTDGEWRNSWYHARLVDYQPDAFCDYASADNTTQSNCYWSFRHFGFVKGAGAPGYAWTVDDVNGGNDFRQFWWTMHTEPGSTIELNGDRALVRGRRTGATLHVGFVKPDASLYPQPHTLELAQDVPWTSSHKYVGREWAASHTKQTVHHATLNRPRLVAKVSGYNGRLLAAMVPTKKGGPAPVFEPLSSLPGSLALRIVFPKVEDTIIFAFANGLLEADDVRGRGRWVAIRRDRKTRRVLNTTLFGGDLLEVAGRSVTVNE